IVKCRSHSLEDVLSHYAISCERLAGRPSEDANPATPTPLLALNLRGKRVAFTGSMLSMSRSDAERLVSEWGGAATRSVSKTLDFLVVGGGGGAGEKLDKARRLVAGGTLLQILTETEFLESLSAENGAVPMHLQPEVQERSHGGAGFAIDIGDYIAAQASTNPESAAFVAAEEARLATLSDEQRSELDADVEGLRRDEQAFNAELDMIRRAIGDQHAQLRSDRKAGIIGSQTEVGQA